jgi:molybdopterin/thiamine biosynthesis adenylyltransferase
VSGTYDNVLRYSRNILVEEIGPSGQDRLFAASVLVVGAGGLGSPALYYLAAAGVGRICIIDGDRVDISNFNRQILHPAASVGSRKVESAANALSAFRPDLALETHACRLTAENAESLFRRHDLVIDGSDNFPTKYLCNDASVVTGVPLVHAGVLGFGGQLLTIVPGKGPCLRCLLPDLPSRGDSPGCAEAGIVGAAAGIFGAWQALEAVKLLTGAGEPLCGRLLTLDTLSGAASILPVSNDPGCPACGDSPRIHAPLNPADYRQEGRCSV